MFPKTGMTEARGMKKGRRCVLFLGLVDFQGLEPWAH